jgi:anti-sigma factor RsiW
MDYEAQLKLQAYLDGELAEGEAREVANWLAKDREAVALHNELRNTRQALAGFEVGRELPESREFYWSKIGREIERLEQAEPVRPEPSVFAAWRRFLVPAGAIAALGVAVLVANRQLVNEGSGQVAELETTRSDPGTFTYRDYNAGATLVWLSYPAEEEVAQNDAVGTFQ